MSEYYRAFLATLKNGDLERRTDTETGEEAIFQNGCLVASSSERKVFPDNLYTEIIKPEPHIIAFGAGHIGKALYDLSDLLSMKFTILDDRAELLTEERFPNAERHVAPYSKLLEREYNAFSPYYAIFTHGHEYDTACLEYALSHKSSYIGMIGSKGKVARTYDILRERGINEEKLMKVHAPIGLGIGAETPEEIAISIMAEIISSFRAEKHITVISPSLLETMADNNDGIAVRIIEKHGSAPRAEGSMMLVTCENVYSTIGGGAIEKDAIDKARKMLINGDSVLLRHYTLNNSSDIGMVCGGDEKVLFTRI